MDLPACTIVFKVTYHERIRRLTFQQVPKFDVLLERITKLLGDPSLNLSYIDEDNDVISVTCNLDIEEAIRYFNQGNGQIVVRLSASRNETNENTLGDTQGSSVSSEKAIADSTKDSIPLSFYVENDEASSSPKPKIDQKSSPMVNGTSSNNAPCHSVDNDEHAIAEDIIATFRSAQTRARDITSTFQDFLRQFLQNFEENFSEFMPTRHDTMDSGQTAAEHNTSHAPSASGTSQAASEELQITISAAPSRVVPICEPVNHLHVVCDGCQKTLKGIRWKCEVCPDFDLCQRCKGPAGRGTAAHLHPDSHHFTPIPYPYHDQSMRTQRLFYGSTCDFCESFITQVRYKCAECPDFDLCARCYPLAETQHPEHQFVVVGFAPRKVAVADTDAVRSNMDRDSTTSHTEVVNELGGGDVLQKPNEVLKSSLLISSESRQPDMLDLDSKSRQVPDVDHSALQADAPRHHYEVEEPYYSAAFVSDITYPDGAYVTPHQSITKTWCMENDGNRAWPNGTVLLCVGGDSMHPTIISPAMAWGRNNGVRFVVPPAAPGEKVNLVAHLRAPDIPGRYTSFWRLVAPDGTRFGHRVWCDITVKQAEETSSEQAPEMESATREKADEIWEPLQAEHRQGEVLEGSSMIFPVIHYGEAEHSLEEPSLIHLDEETTSQVKTQNGGLERDGDDSSSFQMSFGSEVVSVATSDISTPAVSSPRGSVFGAAFVDCEDLEENEREGDEYVLVEETAQDKENADLYKPDTEESVTSEDEKSGTGGESTDTIRPGAESTDTASHHSAEQTREQVLPVATSTPPQETPTPQPMPLQQATTAVAPPTQLRSAETPLHLRRLYPHENQVRSLYEMGFRNRELNRHLLEAYNGDFESVLQELLETQFTG
ncbi:uncharacterized protein VTP21DRAFT_11698 [Calcarisporiella thermophila]|uniref:uncharacterized protein n=1 Tax=Calcarisporiella thermophila TaxID=911321 RepID=UPI00374225EE